MVCEQRHCEKLIAVAAMAHASPHASHDASQHEAAEKIAYCINGADAGNRAGGHHLFAGHVPLPHDASQDSGHQEGDPVTRLHSGAIEHQCRGHKQQDSN
eukprot:TRINITY_DN35820_c0_g2_i1.p1 TRINITY_DN35820_c0_g2~~TRINITY_DN35820_c0_g2_i1.p1  ORF type:complete len:100 (-),score=7.89 TRINITY_DN35820_c0_g2_i1:66-365(-)